MAMARQLERERSQRALEFFNRINVYIEQPAYEQITGQLRFAIASGVFKAGDRMPPANVLAEHLGLNFKTVTRAYRELSIMGLLYCRQGRGVFIREGVQQQCRQALAEELVVRLHQTVTEATASGMTRAEIQTVVQKCLASKTQPYEPAPASIAALAKPKRT